MKKEFALFVTRNGHLSGLLFNILIYGLIYHFISFEWAVVIGIAQINTDQDWTNILLFKSNQPKLEDKPVSKQD